MEVSEARRLYYEETEFVATPELLLTVCLYGQNFHDIPELGWRFGWKRWM